MKINIVERIGKNKQILIVNWCSRLFKAVLYAEAKNPNYNKESHDKSSQGLDAQRILNQFSNNDSIVINYHQTEYYNDYQLYFYYICIINTERDLSNIELL